jgi:hypothetical protein
VLVTEEGGVPVRRKVGALNSLAILDRREATLRGMALEDVIEALRLYCQDQQDPVVVFIDTLAVWGDIQDENDAAEITPVISKFAILAQEAGAAIFLIDHVRKEGGTHGRGIRGSGAKAATADVFAVLDYIDGGSKTQRSLKIEGRVLDPTELRLDFDPSTRDYRVVDRDESDLENIERWLTDIPATGPGMPTRMLGEAWNLTRGKTNSRAEWLCDKGRMRVRVGKAEGNNANVNLYWSIPAVPRDKRLTEEED